MKMQGNTVLITGGSSGIGYAMAEAFLARGNEVLICARGEDRLREAQRRHRELHVKLCDVADAAGRASLLGWVQSEHPAVNVLVNNAGIQRDIDFTRGLDEYLSGPSEIAINLEAPVLLTGMFIPHLAEREGAAIVNVSSGLGFIPAARMPVYSATKAGLHAFSMAIRHQLKPTGISVFEVVPPAVDTALNEEGRARRGGYRAGLGSEEFVAAVMTGLEKNLLEIGYGMTEKAVRASRDELDRSFEQMNGRW